MQNFSKANLAELTIGLANALNDQDRFNRLIDAVRKVISCDCIVLMARKEKTLVPLSMQGLTRDTLGRRFIIDDHPRFTAICNSHSPVRFSSHSKMPDPFDGLLLDHSGDVPIHSCMGLPLMFGEELLGVLTLDSLQIDAFDEIPDRNLEILSAIAASTLKMALTMSQLEAQALNTQQRMEELNQEASKHNQGELIGASKLLVNMKADIDVVAPSNFNILIYGETGVGKELVARQIHNQSPRHRQPLIYVNCAAIPENLVESELFGHVKGAFTGADRDRLGKFALADGGTLLLDEIGELPLAAQSKLLRALQNNEIQPVGKDNIQTIDVRVLAATNRDLKQEVDQGRFRADLYHRLSVYPIRVPALRERNDDIALLSGYFLENARRRLGLDNLKLSLEALSLINQYSWPGNVRELEHVINRATLRAKARQRNGETKVISVTVDDIGELDITQVHDNQSNQPVVHPPNNIDYQQGLREATNTFQAKIIRQALIDSNFNWAKAGRELNVDRANLTRLAKRLGIEVEKNHKILG
ncbi:nitric oxide reductase transcriptional regulator NorR [Vibrio sp. RC27]